MGWHSWSKSNAEYTRKLVHSAAEGAHCGEQAFLGGEPLTSYLSVSARSALGPAVVGAFLGALSSYSADRHKPNRALALGSLGCAIGFAAGVLWQSRRLTASVADGAWNKISKVRDEHWFDRNPIDYA